RDMEFPVGYIPLIVWKLAEALLPEYPQDNPQVISEIKNQSATLLRQIKSMNSAPGRVEYDPSLLNGVGIQSRRRTW
ncbi:MAG TPA: hypothetical protein VEC93_08940, partial [Anaerolineae bacterium]|nr:hypothetical protein [Anaerolineae bacterium]